FFQAEDGIRDLIVTGVQTCALPIFTKGKALTDEWLEVMRVWHQLGGRSSATMMFGHIETYEDRVEHLTRLRELQDETGGFTAFRSEERRVGKEERERWRQGHEEKKE